MPKLPKFEDWVAPWEKNETEFDAEKAKKLIYDKSRDAEELNERLAAANTKNSELQTTLDAKLREGLSAEEKAAAERADLEKKLADAGQKDLEVARLEIALDKGLTKDQAKRLLGSTVDELQADADVLVETFGLGKPADGDEEDGNEGGRKVTNRRAPNVVNGGRKPGDTDAEVSIDDALKLVPRI